jgi:hypothetical protein
MTTVLYKASKGKIQKIKLETVRQPRGSQEPTLLSGFKTESIRFWAQTSRFSLTCTQPYVSPLPFHCMCNNFFQTVIFFRQKVRVIDAWASPNHNGFLSVLVESNQSVESGPPVSIRSSGIWILRGALPSHQKENRGWLQWCIYKRLHESYGKWLVQCWKALITEECYTWFVGVEGDPFPSKRTKWR